MDLSIKLITPEIMSGFGAEAFDQGLGERDHGLVDREAVKHWQAGWHRRRVERQQASQRLTQVQEAA